MREEVVKAVDSLGTRFTSRSDGAREVDIVEQALRDQEAEIAGLRSDLRDADERSALRSRERTEAVQQAEQAEALLRRFMKCTFIRTEPWQNSIAATLYNDGVREETAKYLTKDTP